MLGSTAPFAGTTMYTPLYYELGGFVQFSFTYTFNSPWASLIAIVQVYTQCDGAHDPTSMSFKLVGSQSSNTFTGLGGNAQKLSGFPYTVCVQNFTLSSPLPLNGSSQAALLSILGSNGYQASLYQVYFYAV